jgi:propanol-preferring alcohol dehydrogenase
VINAIGKEETDKACLLDLNYQDHLWREKEIKTVANITHFDIADFLPIAGRIPLKPDVKILPLEQANEALAEIRRGGIRGARVLQVSRD